MFLRRSGMFEMGERVWCDTWVVGMRRNFISFKRWDDSGIGNDIVISIDTVMISFGFW